MVLQLCFIRARTKGRAFREAAFFANINMILKFLFGLYAVCLTGGHALKVNAF